jgi:arylsulfatase A-like enzyme
MTGSYAWRRPDTGIAPGDAALLIPLDWPTVPSVLKSAGYRTGLVGKWHLGLGATPPDFNREIRPGPLELGFDSAFFLPATGDRVPCVFVADRTVVGWDPADPIRVSYGAKVGDEPTGLSHSEQLLIKADRNHSQTIINGVSRIGYMSGGRSARWVDQDMADVLAGRAVAFLESQRAGEPFFLYLATHDIHEPMVPHPRFRGTSGCGWRGDAIHQLDWTVGEVLATIDRLGMAAHTLVIFTSDNGGAIKNTYDDGTNHLHGLQAPNGVLRGRKASLYEGGHRVPFLARWPGFLPPGTDSPELIAHLDMLPTFAALAGASVPSGGAADAVDLAALFRGEASARGRRQLVLQNNAPAPLALRAGRWKLVEKPGSEPELYDLAGDLPENFNVAARFPEQVRELEAALARIRAGQQDERLAPSAPRD